MLVVGALLAVGGIAVLIGRVFGPVRVRRGPTWVCGFKLDATMQYGSAAFAKPARLFFSRIVQPERSVGAEHAFSPYFPTRLSYRAGIRPVFEQTLYRPLLLGLLRSSGRFRAIQSGSLRLYLGYIFATLVILLVVSR